MATDNDVRKSQRATIMAIGTATPTNRVDQSAYPDFYFRITNSEHKTELKDKFKRICMLPALLTVCLFNINIRPKPLFAPYT
ncbi:hypothetical protein SLE2022_220470 [Rubroshorea leprosula]